MRFKLLFGLFGHTDAIASRYSPMETRSIFKYNSAVQIKLPIDRIKENSRPWVVNSALEILIFKM